MGQGTQRAISEAIQDATRGGGQYANAIIPAAVSAAMTSQSLGGLLQRLFGYTYDTREQPYIYQPAAYPIATSATLGVLVASQIVITQDSDFITSKLTGIVGVADASTHDFTVQLVFSNTDRQWVSGTNGVHVMAAFGTAQRPYILPKPWLIARNSRITVNTYSLSANSRDFYMDLHGYRVLDVSSLDLTTRR